MEVSCKMEVVRSNFEETFPTILSALERGAFVAIDTEFTLLVDDESSRPSLFDSGEERYRKLKRIVERVTLCQIGLSVFEDVSDVGLGGSDSRYVAHTFNFYLYPKAYGPIDVRFKCQASSLEFLCQHSFDFNKFVYEGIPFLNREQKRQLSSYLESQTSLAGLDRQLDEERLQAVCSRVAEFLTDSNNGEGAVLLLAPEKTLNEFTVHAELRQRFPERVWTNFKKDGIVEVVKVSPSERQRLNVEKGEALKENTLKYMMGFSRVFDEIVKQQKPVVGHNLFMDLMFLHEKFYDPLPSRLKVFKKNINRLMPAVFDTKNIIHTEKRKLEDDMGFDFQTTSLMELFRLMDTDKGKLGSLYSPVIDYAAPGKYSQGQKIPHEAGYDSYLAGYVFLRLAHLITTRDIKATEAAPVRCAWYFHSMRRFLNKINIIRASIDHLSLDADQRDPLSRRPQLIVVASRRPSIPLEPAFVASQLANFGSVDIRPLTPFSVCVALGTFRAYNDVLEFCAASEELACYRYKFYKDSSVAKKWLWGIAVVSSCLATFILFKNDFNSVLRKAKEILVH